MRAGSYQWEGRYFVSSILGQQVRIPPSQRAARTNAAPQRAARTNAAVAGSRTNGKGGAVSKQSVSSEQSATPVDAAFLGKIITSLASASPLSSPQALTSPQACDSGGSGHVVQHRIDGFMSPSQGVGTFMGSPSFQGQLGLAHPSGVLPDSGSSWPHIQHGPNPHGHGQSTQYGHLPQNQHWPAPPHGPWTQIHHGQRPPPQHGHFSPSHHGPWHHSQQGPWPLPHSGHQLTPSSSDDGNPEEPRN